MEEQTAQWATDTDAALEAARALGQTMCCHCPYDDICDKEERPMCYVSLEERAYPWKDDVREGYYRHHTYPPIHY